MMPYDNYRLYQTERPKSAAEMRYADEQAAQVMATVSGLFRRISRASRIARSYRRDSLSCAAQCAAESAVRC